MIRVKTVLASIAQQRFSGSILGWMYTAPIVATMLGGVTVNVSGPCLRPEDVVKVIFDEYSVDCVKVN